MKRIIDIAVNTLWVALAFELARGQQCYRGPGGVVMTRDEAEKLLELLSLNPAAWNAELRKKVNAYLTWAAKDE